MAVADGRMWSLGMSPETCSIIQSMRLMAVADGRMWSLGMSPETCSIIQSMRLMAIVDGRMWTLFLGVSPETYEYHPVSGED